MKRALFGILGLTIALAAGTFGCTQRRGAFTFQDQSLARYQNAATEIEFPDVATPSNPQAASTPAPIVIPTGPDDPEPVYWELTAEEAVQTALQNSTVLRDLGGLVLQSPTTIKTVQGPAIVETDPRFGVDAALSAFDANLVGSMFWENNDRALNNQFFGGGTRLLRQQLAAHRFEINKRTAYGTTFSARNTYDWDANNAPGNQFPSAWTVFLEAEARQPLLQGAGALYNRTAGPGAVPGLNNGVLIARLNTDVAIADFELGVRNMVNDVETAYWELYYAYRDLDTKLAARDRALTTWRTIKAWNEENRRGGEADKEAQAREQYYRLEEEVQNALTGRLEDRIRVTVFRGQGGVQQSERRLRLLMGVPITDGRLIRPARDPQMARVVFQWEDVLEEALTRREELRRTKWLVKRRELELVASRNFLLPRLDAISRYRWRGFGQHLDGNSDQFDNAWANLLTGDFQEWQLGVEMNMPIGFRKAHAGVRNAQLLLARERAVLDEQEREVTLDLSNAIGEMDRAYVVSQTNYNRRLAAKQQLEVLESNFQDADGNEIARLLDLLLDAQRRLAEAEAKYFRSLVEYELAVKNVHYNKGSLLEYDGVFLSEGAWPNKAYDDAAIKARSRGRQWSVMNYVMSGRRPVVSQGPYGSMSVDVPADAVPVGSPAGFDSQPRAGFDHQPPGGIPQPRQVNELGSAPAEGNAPTPVRIMPDPSIEYQSLSDEGPGVYRDSAALAPRGRVPAQVIGDFDDAQLPPEQTQAGQPVVRMAPSGEFGGQTPFVPAQATVQDSGWDSRPASYEPMREAKAKKPATPKKIVPFGTKKF